eukprot:COSAG05_NODE_367_length_10739_cov_10.311842_12_plen_328_part_00
MPVMLDAFRVRALALTCALVAGAGFGLLLLKGLTAPPTICSSIDPCHCHSTEQSCLCSGGTLPGPECLQTQCNWHLPDGQSSVGLCDTCDSAHHCHGCSTEDSCKGANYNKVDNLCVWHQGECKDQCSSYACSSCESETSCMQHALCHWVYSVQLATPMCMPRCDRHFCGGCTTEASCLEASSDSEQNWQVAGCAWDAVQSVCEHTCASTTAPGNADPALGCWTCTTKYLCEDKGAPDDQCSWDDDNAVCVGANSDEVAVHYGDVVNPAAGELEHIEQVVGNLLVEHAERAGQNDDVIYDHLAGIKVVIGSIALFHSKDIEELVLGR